MARIITAKQSRQARSLLKWNVHDVVSKCRLNQRRLDHFERGIGRLTRSENDQLVKAYIDHGIIFTKDLDVRLVSAEVKKQRSRINEDIVSNREEMKELHFGTENKPIELEEELEKARIEQERLLIRRLQSDDFDTNIETSELRSKFNYKKDKP